MTELQTRVVDALRGLGGSATTRDIAEQLGEKPRSVSNALQWLRGSGVVHDGSTSRRVGSNAFLWTAGPRPIVWTLISP